MERTIRRSGRLFRYAYWFRPPEKRPTTINRCPFFWRQLVGGTLLMIPYWTLWVPFAFFVGFWFGSRPNIFKDDHYYEWGDDVFQYAWTFCESWPYIGGRKEGIPALPIIPVAILGLGVLFWKLLVWNFQISLGGHTPLFWLFLVLVFWVMIKIARRLLQARREKAVEKPQEKKKPEWLAMLQDHWKERKKGLCPSYRVVD